MHFYFLKDEDFESRAATRTAVDSKFLSPDSRVLNCKLASTRTGWAGKTGQERLGSVGFCEAANHMFPDAAGDDAIATSGFYYLVATSDPGQKSVIIASDREFTFNPGDLLTFYAQDSERLGTARIVKMYSVEEPKQVSGKTSRVAGAVKYDDADFMKVSALPFSK